MNENALVEWLRRTEAVEVSRDEDGPYATKGTTVPEYPWCVWVSNGDTDPRMWAGTLIARCSSEHDARLVATALDALRVLAIDHTTTPGATNV